MKNFPFRNLVFKGGGVKGIAYVGALKALEEAQIIHQITGFAGTSAGSIVAALAAMKISSDKLNDFLADTNYEKFKDSGGVFTYVEDLVSDFGPYKGDYFLNDWFKVFMEKNGIDPTITFEGLVLRYGSSLKVFATDLNLQAVQEFSTQATPNVQVALAVRASMSIPLFFKAWKFPDNNPSDHIYVDGGVMYNYPIFSFDSVGSNPDQTLGFYLLDLSQQKTPNNLDYGVKHIETYVKSVFESLLTAQDSVVKESKFEQNRTVQIDDLGISAVNFGITPAQVKALYNSGYEHTQQFLAQYPPPAME